MIKLRVVTVTNDLETFPYHREDSEEFPHLAAYVGNGIRQFVVDEDGGWWFANELFECVNITHFIVDSSERPA